MPVRAGMALARCRECAVTCLEPEPNAEVLRASFDDGYFAGGGGDAYGNYLLLERSLRRQARRRLRLLPRPVPGGAPRLLDVGCAAGFLLDEARKQGWDVVGIEANDSMARHGREVLGLDIRTGTFEQDVVRGPFDAVVMLNVLEHLPDPQGVERRLAELVRPGGMVLIETWNAASLVARLQGGRWHQWSPAVPYYHVRRSLVALFDGARWVPTGWRRASKWIPLWRGLEILGVRPRHADARLRRPWRWELPYAAGDLVVATFRRGPGQPDIFQHD